MRGSSASGLFVAVLVVLGGGYLLTRDPGLLAAASLPAGPWGVAGALGLAAVVLGLLAARR